MINEISRDPLFDITNARMVFRSLSDIEQEVQELITKYKSIIENEQLRTT